MNSLPVRIPEPHQAVRSHPLPPAAPPLWIARSEIPVGAVGPSSSLDIGQVSTWAFPFPLNRILSPPLSGT